MHFCAHLECSLPNIYQRRKCFEQVAVKNEAHMLHSAATLCPLSVMVLDDK